MTEEGSGVTSGGGVESSEFLRVSGLRVEEVSGDGVRGWIDLDEGHHTPWGVVHGGVYAAAVESAASLGASAAVEERGQFAVGLNNNTDFLRPMSEGRAEVVAEPIMQGKSQQLWQVIITRAEDGKEVARGQLRLQNVPLQGGSEPPCKHFSNSAGQHFRFWLLLVALGRMPDSWWVRGGGAFSEGWGGKPPILYASCVVFAPLSFFTPLSVLCADCVLSRSALYFSVCCSSRRMIRSGVKPKTAAMRSKLVLPPLKTSARAGAIPHSAGRHQLGTEHRGYQHAPDGGQPGEPWQVDQACPGQAEIVDRARGAPLDPGPGEQGGDGPNEKVDGCPENRLGFRCHDQGEHEQRVCHQPEVHRGIEQAIACVYYTLPAVVAEAVDLVAGLGQDGYCLRAESLLYRLRVLSYLRTEVRSSHRPPALPHRHLAFPAFSYPRIPWIRASSAKIRSPPRPRTRRQQISGGRAGARDWLCWRP